MGKRRKAIGIGETVRALGFLFLFVLFMLSIMGGFSRTLTESLGWAALLAVSAKYVIPCGKSPHQ